MNSNSNSTWVYALASRSAAVVLAAVVALFTFSGCGNGFGNAGSSGGSGSGGNGGDAYSGGDDTGGDSGGSSSDDGSGSGSSDGGGSQDAGYTDSGSSNNDDAGTEDDAYGGGTRDWITTDQKLSWMEDDILSIQPPAEREDIRYISLVHQHNDNDVSDDQLDKLRNSMSMVINSLSFGQNVVKPEPIDGYNTVYRIELDDYGWDAETWDQIVEIYPYAVQYDQDSRVFPVNEDLAERLRDETGEDIPYVQADWFIDETTKAPLYYDILELPENLAQLEDDLGVDIEENIANEEVDRAGFDESGPSDNNRVIERHELDAGQGALWVSYDFITSDGDQNIKSTPIGFDEDGGEMIFNLPNGLQAYYIAEADGTRLDKAPQAVVTDSSRPDNAVQTGISCLGCHNGAGIIPKQDEIREHANTSLSGDERDAVLALYPEQSVLDGYYDSDGELFLNAKEATGLDRGSSTTVLNIVLTHEEGLSLTDVAMNLGISKSKLETELSASFEQLPDEIKTLRNQGGTIDRDTYEDVEDEVVCALGLGEPLDGNGNVVDCGEVLSN